MKNCTNCAFADWNKTKGGKLHPSGTGWCRKEVKLPQLPASMYWLTTPHSAGGHINRREELNTHCTYYTRKES